MPVPTTITDLSQTAGSNYPQGTDSPSTLDDVQRAHASFIALLRDSKGATAVATLASAGTVDVGGANSYAVEITGTTTITSFGTNYSGPRFVRLTGALILTHNATLLNLPGAASITTAAGDTLIATPNSTGNGWNVVTFTRAAALPVYAGGDLGASTTATTQALGDNSTKLATTAFVLQNSSPVGSIGHFPFTAAPAGWLKANGSTIGNASSGGTLRANDDTLNLFTVLWNNVANTELPIQTSTGAASTRGVDAATDFAANKRLPVPDLRAEFIRGLDDGRGVDAGRALASLQDDDFESHTHPQTASAGGGPFNTYQMGTYGGITSVFSNITGPTGGSETRPRNVSLLACIKY